MTQPRFKVGDRVRCLNKSHPGLCIFEISAFYDMGGFDGLLYYPIGKNAASTREETHDHGYLGCRESDLELVK